MYKNIIRPPKWALAVCLLPGLAVYSFAVLGPLLGALHNSLYRWKGGSNMTFIGLKNYSRLLGDDMFWHSFANNAEMLAYSLLGHVGLALFFSMLLYSRCLHFKKLHRTMCYFPATLSAVVVSFVWMLLYNYKFGLINVFFRQVGLDSWAQPWLELSGPIMLTVTVPLIWQNIGANMIILLSAIASISKDVMEMAEIDGARGLKKAWYITLPQMKPTIIVAVMLCIAQNMKGFENVFLMTGGGPGDASSLVALYAYKTAFVKFNYGYGSAVAIGIVILSLVIITVSGLVTRGHREAEG